MTLSLRKNGNGEGYAPAFPLTDWGAFDRLFDQITPAAVRRAFPVSSVVAEPAVELTHNGSELVLRAEVPGIDKKDIELTVHDDVLTLKGVKQASEETNEGGYHYTERRYGSFSRTFSLPFPVDTGRVQASLKDGILEARLPIIEEAKPRRVEIA